MQRKDDPGDYDPNPTDLEAESSIGEVGFWHPLIYLCITTST
jgi:hypothetical protein